MYQAKTHMFSVLTVGLLLLTAVGCSTIEVTYEASARINDCGSAEGRETQPFEVVLIMPGDPPHTDAIYQPKEWFGGGYGKIPQDRVIADSVRRSDTITRSYEHPKPGDEGAGVMIIPNYLDPTGECPIGKSLWCPTSGFGGKRSFNVLFEGTNVRLK